MNVFIGPTLIVQCADSSLRRRTRVLRDHSALRGSPWLACRLRDYSAQRASPLRGIALRSPCCAQALGGPSMATRATHASRPFGRSTSLRDVVEPVLFVCRGFE